MTSEGNVRPATGGLAWLGLLAVLVGGAASTGATPAAATVARTEEAPDVSLPDLDQIDPPRYAYDDAIVEAVQVTTRTGTPVGTGTGASPTDARIWVDLIRPHTDTPVPTILIASPYYNTLGRGWRSEGKQPAEGGFDPPTPGLLSGGYTPVPFPEWYDEYFVPRGYAVALMDLRGTRNSSGCQVYGDRDEIYDVVDVVDWIADQAWSNGKVGMTGGSYDGTLAIGAAAEQPLSGRHPDALAAVIPIRAIDRWYDYHFFNGVQSLGHALTPALFTAALAGEDVQNAAVEDDLLLPLHVAERKACIATIGAAVDAGYASPYQDATSPFWVERDFTKDAPTMRAATFLIAGLFDFNVKAHNTGYLWEALPGTLPRKLWLANMDHADPHVPTRDEAGSHVVPFPYQGRFVEWTHRWYAQFLKGLDAGALQGPTVEIQRADGTWDADDRYPAATGDLVLHPGPDGRLRPGTDRDGAISWSDEPRSGSEARLVTAPFGRDTRLSGQIGFDLTISADGPDTTIGVEVAMLPPDVDDDVPAGTVMDAAGDPVVISYAWLRAFYRDSVPLRGISTPTGGAPLVPGAATPVSFGSIHTDVVVPAGWRLRLTFANQAGGTVPAGTGHNVRLLTAASEMLLPVVGPPPEFRDESSAPAQSTVPLPTTGGGLALVGLVLTGSAVLGRRRHADRTAR